MASRRITNLIESTLALVAVVLLVIPVQVAAEVPHFPCSDGAQAFLLAAPGGGFATPSALAPDGSAVLGSVAGVSGYWLRSEQFAVFHSLAGHPVAGRVISNGARYVAGTRAVNGVLEGVRVELATGAMATFGPIFPQSISGDGSRIAGVTQVANSTCSVVPNNDEVSAPALVEVDTGGLTILPFPLTSDAGLVSTVADLLYDSLYGFIGGFRPQNSSIDTVISSSGTAVAGTITTGVWVDLFSNLDGNVCVDIGFPQSCSLVGPVVQPCPLDGRCEPWAGATCVTTAGGGSNAVRWVNGAPEVQARPAIDIAATVGLPDGTGPADIRSAGAGEAQALSISDDGRVVVGRSIDEKVQNGGGTVRTRFVTRWEDGGPFEHLWEGRIASASTDGEQVVGYGQYPPGHARAGISATFHWDRVHGLREIHGALRDDYGLSGGVDLSRTPGFFYASLHGGGGTILSSGRLGGTFGIVAVVLPCSDRDQDNLCDVWEDAGGIDINGDGSIVPVDDLLLPGADPDHRDVYVEVDVVQGSNLPAAARQAVEAAFAEVPNSKIGNPDGEPGINLHLLPDETGLTLLSGTQYQPVGGGCQLPPDLDVLRQTRFGTPVERANADVIAAKHKLFRYLVYGGTRFNATSGRAELPGNSAIVTLDNFTTLAGFSNDWISGTIMHELGHTFGLGHGGGDHIGYKPNYHSVMSYSWQLRGEQLLNTTLERRALAASWLLDYSRRPFDPLDETRLFEGSGIGGAFGRVTPAGPLAACPSGGGSCIRVVLQQGAVDWDQDGSVRDLLPLSVPVDINDLRGDPTSSPTDLLVSQDDWTVLAGRLCSDYAHQNWDSAFDGSTAACGVGITAVEERTAAEAEAFLTQPMTIDCNLDGRHDQDEIDEGSAADLDGNGVLDGCEPLEGDLDGDDDVDLDDRDRLVASFGLREGEPGYEALADFDSDRLISFVDYQLWIGHHDAFSDPGQAASACGLIGIELLPLVALALRRRSALRGGRS